MESEKSTTEAGKCGRCWARGELPRRECPGRCKRLLCADCLPTKSRPCWDCRVEALIGEVLAKHGDAGRARRRNRWVIDDEFDTSDKIIRVSGPKAVRLEVDFDDVEHIDVLTELDAMLTTLNQEHQKQRARKNAARGGKR